MTVTMPPRNAGDKGRRAARDQEVVRHPLRVLAIELLAIGAAIALYLTGTVYVPLTLALVGGVVALTVLVFRANPRLGPLGYAFIVTTVAAFVLGVFLITQSIGAGDEPQGYQTSTDFVEDQLGGPIAEPEPIEEPPVVVDEEIPFEDPPAEQNPLPVRLEAWASYVLTTDYADDATRLSVAASNDEALQFVNDMLKEQPTANGVIFDPVSSSYYPDGAGGFVFIEPGGQWLPQSTEGDLFYQGLVEWQNGERTLELIHLQWTPIGYDSVTGTFLIVENSG